MLHRFLAIVFTATASSLCLGENVKLPKILDSNWQIELISSEPALVTPTGCCFDDQGKLLVIECHTHFPPEDYKGPKIDRIYRYDDSNGDGVLDRKSVFHEGGTATMNITNIGDGWIAIATRSEVYRIKDADNDGMADKREVLLTHKTAATYPHNGLGGLNVSRDGWLYVGQGENFGEAYELIGTDGSKQIGKGEGGNIFRCKTDGSQLERVATGFWNPFGLCFDHTNRLWKVGNDPDAMPPNRLLNVVSTGDYGFQFRFGRAGTNPLLAWNGELPATLPMAAGVGEAACNVVVHGEHLWVSSWGDNRIERYKLVQDGATWKSKTEVVFQGDANFRPVGMAVAKDGSIYVTDWVDRNYSVHSKGRLWRLSQKDATKSQGLHIPDRSPEELKATKLADSSDIPVQDRIAALDDKDPYIRQAAIAGLLRSKQYRSVSWNQLKSSLQKVGLIAAWRWQELSNPESVTIDERRKWIESGLADASNDVIVSAARWATERNAKEQLPTIRKLLESPSLTPHLFSFTIASIAYLETGSASGARRDPAIEKLLIEFAGNEKQSGALRALAVRRIPSESEQPKDLQLGEWTTKNSNPTLTLECIRLLGARNNPSANAELNRIVSNDKLSDQTRADALASLTRNGNANQDDLRKYASSTNQNAIRKEAVRILKEVETEKSINRPAKDDLDGWDSLVGKNGDPLAGQRVFARSACVNCHAYQGRGSKTGPDLTTIAGQMTSRRLIESILLPSKEVGPLYVPWKILTVDGTVLTGLKIDASGVGNKLKFQSSDGKTFELGLQDIDTQEPMSESIMPNGLEEQLSIEELRDLIAFLLMK